MVTGRLSAVKRWQVNTKQKLNGEQGIGPHFQPPTDKSGFQSVVDIWKREAYGLLPVNGTLLTIIFGALKFTGISLTFLVALLTGLTVKPLTKSDLGWPLLTCALLVLIIEPILAYEFDLHIGEETPSSALLLLLGAMPSSPIAIALSLRYGCDVDLSSKLVVGTCILCAITLPSIAYFYS